MKARMDRSKLVIAAETPTDHMTLGVISSALQIPTSRIFAQKNGKLHLRLTAPDVLGLLIRRVMQNENDATARKR